MIAAAALETLLAFVLGIAAASFNVSLIIVLAVGYGAVIGLRHMQATGWAGLFCVFAALLFGFVYFFLYRNVHTAYTILPQGNNVSFTGIVTDEPRTTERSLRFSLALQSPHRGILTVILPPNRDLRYGD